jgi:ribosomal RNA assembly protein
MSGKHEPPKPEADGDGNVPVVNKNKRYEREKPWDNDPTLDKWKVTEFKPEHNPHGMVEESSFSCLFP